MNRVFKIILGIITFWPILYIILFVLSAFFLPNNNPLISNWSEVFPVFFGLHIFTMILIFALVITYIIIIIKNDRIVKETKILWVVMTVWGNMLTMPIYWCLHIWRKPKDSKVNKSL